MSALKRRLAARRARKQKEAYDRLHGVGAVPVAPRRGRRSRGGSGDWADDLGELIVDLACAAPRAVLWVFSKLFD